MLQAGPAGVRVSRLCRIRTERNGDETPFAVDVDGFLDESLLFRSGGDEPLAPGMLVRPERAAEAANDASCLGIRGRGSKA
jgi:hypothetical protein